MLLEDLIDTKKKERNVSAIRHNTLQHRHTRFKERGSYGGVKPLADPHLIQKSNFVPSHEKEGYYSYIKYVVDNKLADSNPYFPRVYNIKTIKDKMGYISYKVDMEQLIPIHHLSEKEVKFVFEKIFQSSTIFDNPFENVNIDNEGLYAWIDELGSWVESSASNPRNFKYNDEVYVEAIKILRDIYTKLKLGWDLHQENFMFRRTSAGVQLVFTDPFV